MTGWKDIDGSNVMAGSPGILGCLEIEFNALLGRLPGQRSGQGRHTSNLDETLKVAEKHGASGVARKLIVAIKLVRAARMLLSWTAREERVHAILFGFADELDRALPPNWWKFDG